VTSDDNYLEKTTNFLHIFLRNLWTANLTLGSRKN